MHTKQLNSNSDKDLNNRMKKEHVDDTAVKKV